MHPTKGTSSLYETGKRQALRIIKNIDDFGDMPFRVAEPLLKKVQTAAHLHRIEVNCPQFVGETREIWINLIKRDLPQWDESEPKNPASWYKLYQKLLAAETKATEEDALILKATMDRLAAEKGDRQILTTNLLHKSKVRGARVAKPTQTSDGSSLRFNSGSRTKTVTGKDVMARARREARERSQAMNTRSVLARPTHQLSKLATTVRHAPAGLVQQHQHQQQANIVRPPRSSARSSEEQASPRKMTPEERAARLKAIKEGQTAGQTISALSRTMPAAEERGNRPLVRAPHSKTQPKRKIDDLDDLFGEPPDEASPPSHSDSPLAKKQHSSQSTQLSNPPKKPATDIFLRKPIRKPVR